MLQRTFMWFLITQYVKSIPFNEWFKLTDVDNLPSFMTYIEEDGRLNFTGLCVKYGYDVRQYEIVTEDGYTLSLFNIPGRGDPEPVLLVHGFSDTADGWIVRGNASIGFALSDAGYDLWFVNFRGNTYSRRHATLNTTNAKFWDFSFHEFGLYDLPASIDFVLKFRSRENLKLVAISQGVTAAIVTLAERPVYNKKISLAICMAPVIFMNHLGNPDIKSYAESMPILNYALNAAGKHELFGDGSFLSTTIKYVCSHTTKRRKICAPSLFYPLTGSDPEQISPNFFPILFGHYPAPTSLKSLVHYSQLVTAGKFAKYSYGLFGNIIMYGTAEPPIYDLAKVTTNVALFCSEKDALASLEDVEMFRSKLSHVVEYYVVTKKKFNHVDFIWASNTRKYVLPKLLEVLDKY